MANLDQYLHSVEAYVIEEVRPGLKRWVSEHPEWNPEEDELDESYRPVASIVFHSPDALVFIDPLVPESPWPALAAEVKTSPAPLVVLTAIKIHVRRRDSIVRR